LKIITYGFNLTKGMGNYEF